MTPTLSATQSSAIKGQQPDFKQQYVDKTFQLTGYEDGSARPSRFKADPKTKTSDGVITIQGGVGAYAFVSSEGINLDGGDRNPGQYILDLEIAKSSYASVGAQTGYAKLGIDLNSGAGGKYIYLCFSRNRVEDHGSCGYGWSDITPVSDISVKAWRATSDAYPPSGFCYIYNPTSTTINSYKEADLNDGASGRYVYSYQSKEPTPTPIREVGIVAGNNSGIQPPPGWVRVGEDCNAGAGGDYIYFCYKR